MRFKSYLVRNGEVIEEEYEVHYDMACEIIGGNVYQGDITKIQTKVSEKLCTDPRILEMFERKEEGRERFREAMRRLFDRTRSPFGD